MEFQLGIALNRLLRHLTNNPASQLCPSISWASSARKILFESGKTQLSQPTSPATHGYALPPISMTIPLFDIPCVASRMTLARPLCRTETLRPCNQRCSGARSFSRESDYLALLASEPRRTQRYDKGTCRPRYCPLSLSQGTRLRLKTAPYVDEPVVQRPPRGARLGINRKRGLGDGWYGAKCMVLILDSRLREAARDKFPNSAAATR